MNLQALDRMQVLVDEQPNNLDIIGRLISDRTALVTRVSLDRFRGQAFHLLKGRSEDLSRLFEADQTSKSLRRELALTNVLLGTIREADSTASNAREFWLAAFKQYKILLTSDRDDFLCKQWLAHCCNKLQKSNESDPYYLESAMLLPDVARHLVAISQNCLGSGRCWQKLAAQNYCHLVANHLRTGRTDRAAATFKIDLEPLVRELSGFRVGGADVELGEQLAALAVKFDKVDRVTALAMARSAAAVVSKDLPERKSDLPYAMGRGRLRSSLSEILMQFGDQPLGLQQAALARTLSEACERIRAADPSQANARRS